MITRRTTLLTATTVAFASTLLSVAHGGGATWEIVDLTELAEPFGVVQSEARAIDEAGEIVGFELVEAFIERAITWAADGTPTLLDPIGSDNSHIAISIGEDGAVFGLSETVTFEQQGELIFIYEDQRAARWQNGVVTDLNDLVTGGNDSITLNFARDVSTSGQIVGFASLLEGPPFFSNGFLLDNGVVTDLGLLERPEAINDVQQVVGSTQGGQAKAYLWDDGTLVNLHDHASITGVTSRAFDINGDELVVGEAQFLISLPEEPTVWIDRVPTPLVPDIARSQGVATAVNERGQVVGFFNDLDDLGSLFRGFLWEDGVRTDLLDLVSPEEGWQVLFPFDVNDRGWIVGGGMRDGQLGRAFVMRPICEGDLDGSGDVGFADLLGVLADWGPCAGCPADLTGDGIVGFDDVLVVLAAWGGCL